jgi:hypothetical protein
MHCCLSSNFNKKVQSARKLHQNSVASPQIMPTNNRVEQQKVEGDLLELSEDRSIIRATYYLQGLLIKTEAFTYQTQQQPQLQHSQSQPHKPIMTQRQIKLQQFQQPPLSPQEIREWKDERNGMKPSKQRSLYSSPRSPEELKERKDDREQRREQELLRDQEIFKNSIKEETQKQIKIIEKYSFVHLNDKEIRKSLTLDDIKECNERFITFMSEVNKTFLVYKGIFSPNEWPIFEAFCNHVIDQIEALAFIDKHQNCDISGVRQFLLECYVLADDTSLDHVEAKVFEMMIQYKIPIGARFYYRRLTNLNYKGDFIGISNVWDHMDDRNRTSIGLKCIELAIGGLVIDNFTKACSILEYIAHTNAVDIRGYPDSIYKIIFQFVALERVTLDTSELNIKNFEKVIQSCASVIRQFQVPHSYSFVSVEQVLKILQICAVSAVHAWDYLSKWGAYVNRSGRIEVYDDMLHISLCFEDGPSMARQIFNEIIVNRIVPRTETLNALLQVHIKYGEFEMAKSIFEKIDFSHGGFTANATTRNIKKQLEEKTDFKASVSRRE